MIRLIVVLILAGLAFVPDTAHAAVAKLIAFVRDGNICVATPQGTGIRQLTKDGCNAHPIWSPSGKLIAFAKASSRSTDAVFTDGALWVMNADGTGARQLKAVKGHAHCPVAWLPRDRGIIYNQTALDTEGLPGRLYTFILTKSARDPIGSWEKSAGRRYKSWNGFGGALASSPSYKQVILTGSDHTYGDESGKEEETDYPVTELYQINYDGSGLRKVTGYKYLDISCLRWNPTRPGILILREHDAGNGLVSDIWLMDDRGRAIRRLADVGAISATGMDWSPDGERIIYQKSTHPEGRRFEHPELYRNLSSNTSIWIMDPRTNATHKLIDNACHPNWQR